MARMSELSERMTTGQVAAAFGVTTSTIRRWVNLQRIPAHRLPSGRMAFLRAEIEPLVPQAGHGLAAVRAS